MCLVRSLSVFSPNDNGILCDYLYVFIQNTSCISPLTLEDISNPVVNLTTFTNMNHFSEEKKKELKYNSSINFIG